MLLAVDVGNTNITFGLFKGSRLVKKFHMPTASYNIKKLKKVLPVKIDDTMICSVVPKALKKVALDLAKLTGRRPFIIGKDIRVPIKNLYRRPRQVGQDRLVNAYAVLKLYGCPAIAVDFGTAVTFDLISRNKIYLGGMIIPGLRISLEVLNKRTALLPQIKLGKPKEFIGRDTRSSMLSGVVYGFASLTDSLASRIKEKVGLNALIIGTGGNIDLMAKYCRTLDFVDVDLTLKGLNIIYKETCDKDS